MIEGSKRWKCEYSYRKPEDYLTPLFEKKGVRLGQFKYYFEETYVMGTEPDKNQTFFCREETENHQNDDVSEELKTFIKSFDGKWKEC